MDENTIAFSGGGYVNKQSTQVVGTIQTDGSHLLVQRKDGTSTPQTANGRSIWRDEHVSVQGSTSGSVVFFKIGAKLLSEIPTKEPKESQDAYLSSDGTYFGTYLISKQADGSASIVFRIYNCDTGKMVKEIVPDVPKASFNDTVIRSMALGHGQGMATVLIQGNIYPVVFAY